MSHEPQDRIKPVASPTVLHATQGPGLRRMHGMAWRSVALHRLSIGATALPKPLAAERRGASSQRGAAGPARRCLACYPHPSPPTRLVTKNFHPKIFKSHLNT